MRNNIFLALPLFYICCGFLKMIVTTNCVWLKNCSSQIFWKDFLKKIPIKSIGLHLYYCRTIVTFVGWEIDTRQHAVLAPLLFCYHVIITAIFVGPAGSQIQRLTKLDNVKVTNIKISNYQYLSTFTVLLHLNFVLDF